MKIKDGCPLIEYFWNVIWNNYTSKGKKAFYQFVFVYVCVCLCVYLKFLRCPVLVHTVLVPFVLDVDSSLSKISNCLFVKSVCLNMGKHLGIRVALLYILLSIQPFCS